MKSKYFLTKKIQLSQNKTKIWIALILLNLYHKTFLQNKLNVLTINYIKHLRMNNTIPSENRGRRNISQLIL